MMGINIYRFILAALASSVVLAVEIHTVKTTHGLIIGHSAPNVSDVVEFLGIPYAEPPVGALRFKPPRPHSRKHSFHATTWGYDCPQTPSKPVDFPGFTPQSQRIINYFAGGGGNAQSEDCLTLNIWTKSIGDYKKPVLVFFHGGRFAIGNANSPFYDGRRLSANTGAIVVTLTYRLNIFGFPGAPGADQNLGLRDQRLAVEWIRDNVEGFGGNPKKITLFGQSSGAVAVDWWAFAHQKDPIARGIISESGNAFSFPANTPAQALKNWYNVSATLGCGDSGDTLACVQSKKWTKILAAASMLPAAPGGNPVRSTPAFYPTIDNVTVFSNYSTLLEAGKFAKIPQLLGSNNHEQGYYVIPVYARGINVTETQGDAFLLQSFTCPVSYEAYLRREKGVPVWVYRYFGDWENIRLYPTSGAYHGAEMEMVFGNSGIVSGIPPSEAEAQLSKLMQHAWAAFANDPKHGLTKFGWPEYNPQRDTLIRLGYNNSATPAFVRPSTYDAQCSSQTLGVNG